MSIALPSRQPRIKRWTKAEYLRLVDAGAFDEDGHFYLFRGELLEMSPMGSPHAIALMKATAVFSKLLASNNYFLRVQLPFDVPGDSVPEPDLAICSREQAFVVPYSTTALLIVEVAESSLDHDRDKALEYAAAKVQEYWIVNLNERCIEMYRDAVPDRSAFPGGRYATMTRVEEQAMIAPLAFPELSLKVSELLP